MKRREPEGGGCRRGGGGEAGIGEDAVYGL